MNQAPESTPLLRKKFGALSARIKKHKKILLILLAGSLVLVGAYYAVCGIVNAGLTNEVQKALDGKAFIQEKDAFATAFVFKGNTMAEESWFSSDQTTSGDLKKPLRYKIKGSLGSAEIEFYVLKDYGWVVSLYGVDRGKDGAILFHSTEDQWRETSLEEVETIRKMLTCKHQFLKAIILSEADCTKTGKQSRTCRLCGYEKEETIDSTDHQYKNGRCTECGQEKPAEKEFGIDPDTWYRYDGILMLQNCRLFSEPAPASSGLLVFYEPICRNCRAVGMRDMTVATAQKPILKYSYCQSCGSNTYVRIEID